MVWVSPHTQSETSILTQEICLDAIVGKFGGGKWSETVGEGSQSSVRYLENITESSWSLILLYWTETSELFHLKSELGCYLTKAVMCGYVCEGGKDADFQAIPFHVSVLCLQRRSWGKEIQMESDLHISDRAGCHWKHLLLIVAHSA